jgi:hypothetical protein
MRPLLIALLLLTACRKPPKVDPHPDAQFIATTKEWQDKGMNIVGPRADAVREVCKHDPEIKDCKIVLSRLLP